MPVITIDGTPFIESEVSTIASLSGVATELLEILIACQASSCHTVGELPEAIDSMIEFDLFGFTVELKLKDDKVTVTLYDREENPFCIAQRKVALGAERISQEIEEILEDASIFC